ncbi:Sucrose transport protein SUC4, partial [Cucurbita argyrosperma subsp. argyrosperma]
MEPSIAGRDISAVNMGKHGSSQLVSARRKTLKDQLFGGGNSPALALAALAAFASGLIAILALPRSTAQKPRTLT